MAAPAAPTVRRLYRRRHERLVAGVASGLADHTGIDVVVLRIGFVVTVLLGGLGVVLYAAFWAVVPQEPDEFGATTPSISNRSQLVAFGGFGLLMLIVAQLIGFGPGLLWPAAAGVTGIAILWRQADETQRTRWRDLTARSAQFATGPGRAQSLVRYGVGAVLVIVGMATFLAAHGQLPQARHALLPVGVVALGLILVIGPWMLRSLRELNDERTVRIREQERVELAGRVHDSMLQTLTLIQRRADDPDEVRRLVRRSERELRGWLYAGATAGASLRTVVAELCAVIEDEYAVTIDLVVVGEVTVTAALEPITLALREATINAAKHSGVSDLSVYVESTGAQITCFIRDRGHGFDPAAVPTDRFGVRDSVIARMQRAGGDAVIRSSPATGTEVRLTLPIPPAAPA